MKEQLEKLQEEEEEDTKRFLELTEGLAVERSEHKHTLAAKDRKIMRLRKQIEQLTLQTQQERSSFEQKMDTEAQYSENVFNATSQDLNAQLSSGSTKLENDGSTYDFLVQLVPYPTFCLYHCCQYVLSGSPLWHVSALTHLTNTRRQISAQSLDRGALSPPQEVSQRTRGGEVDPEVRPRDGGEI